MLKLIKGHQGTIVSKLTLNYLLVYNARCNADREVGLLISRTSKTRALNDIQKDKDITEICAKCLAQKWLPQMILGRLLDFHLHWEVSEYSLVIQVRVCAVALHQEKICGAAITTFTLVIMSKAAGCEGWKDASAWWPTDALGVWDTATAFHFPCSDEVLVSLCLGQWCLAMTFPSLLWELGALQAA